MNENKNQKREKVTVSIEFIYFLRRLNLINKLLIKSLY